MVWRRYHPGRRGRCETGKIRYRDQHSAKIALRIIRDTSTASVVPIREYACPFCRGFHLTSQEQR